MKRMVMIILVCLLAGPGVVMAETVDVTGIQTKTPNYVIDNFPTGEYTITDEMIPKLQAIVGRSQMSPDERIELMGWVSDPPRYSRNNLTNQRQLARNRAMAVANWLTSHGVPHTRIVVFTVPGRGLSGNQFRDQRVDVYFVPAGAGRERLEEDIRFECPPGYTPHYEYNPVRENGVITVHVYGWCELDEEETVTPEPGGTTDPPHPCDTKLPPRYCDPKYYAIVGGCLAAGCAGGLVAAQAEGGEGADAGDAHGGDGGDMCGGNPGACIIGGCATGWAVGVIWYEIDRAKRERELTREERAAVRQSRREHRRRSTNN